MDATTLLAHLASDGPLLTQAATRTRWDAPVSGLDWTVRELVIHTGAVQRWCADIVRRKLSSNVTGGSSAFRPAELPGDDEMLDWFTEGHRELVTVLTAAPPDLDVWTFDRTMAPRDFWIRRQAHELAIHRADVQLAGGAPAEFDVGLAQDGIAEALGFAGERRFVVPRPGRLVLDATDGPSWLITFGGGCIRHEAHDGDMTADATVRGRCADLYLWVWNRRSGVTIDGDADTAALWTRTVRV